MPTNRKNSGSNLKQYYNIFLEGGLVVVLIIFIIAMKINIKSGGNKVDLTQEQETVTMKKVKRTRQQKKPPPPPTPKVPVQVPNDKVIKDQHLNLDSEINLDKPLPEPPKHTQKRGNKKEKIFRAVEQQAHIVGGQKALAKKLQGHYPESCKRAHAQGRVIVNFVVNTDGSIQNVKIVRGIGHGCDKAAVKALKSVKWVPGRQRGKAVREQISWPVTFRLE